MNIVDKINSFKRINIKIKPKRGWLFLAIIILILVGLFIIKSVFKNPLDDYIIETVGRGDVLQEVSETANVKPTENLSLSFKIVGKVSKIYVAVGDKVKKGEKLAQLESSQLLAQLQSAKAALRSITNQYEGNVALAKDNLQAAYNNALNILNDAYIKIYNAYNAVKILQDAYFNTTDQEGIKVSISKDNIQQNMKTVEVKIKKAQSSQNYSDIDSAVSETLVSLDNIYNDLKIIRDQCESGIHYYSVSSSYKSSIDTHKLNINTALTNLTASQSSISSAKIALEKAEDKMIDKENTNDSSTLSSQVAQAQANVNAIESQLNDTYLISPIDGIITKVDIKNGQVVSPSQSVINLLSLEPFEIKTYIYEQDIVNVKIGDPVKINLIAFPGQTFYGRVVEIDPGETIIDNIVYYGVTIDFPKQPAEIRPGMTADITIETNKKENVLRVPKNAVRKINGEGMVQIIKNRKTIDQKIVLGLEGNDYYEVLSGLLEGDKIIVGKK